MSDEGWEERMAQKHKARHGGTAEDRYGIFARYLEPSDPEDITPKILAARCLGITYGDPGPLLPYNICHHCWGERYVWYGNTWGLNHIAGAFRDCKHECHQNEVWMAGAESEAQP